MRSRRPIRCSTTARVPRQIEEHEPAAELEVPPLAARLGRDQEGRPFRQPELRHLDVPPLRATAPRGRCRPRRPCRSIAALSSSSVSRWATKTSVFSSGPVQRAACSASQRTRGSCVPGLGGQARRSQRPRRSTPAERRAAGEARARKTRSAFRRRARAFSAGWARGAAATSRSSGSQSAAARSTGDRRRAAAGRRCPRGGWSWCRAAAARGGPAAPRRTPARETPRAAGAGAGGRSRGRRPPAAWR